MVVYRFAQRVSLIKNKAVLNEDLDPAAVIRRLKEEILSLREEISFLKVCVGRIPQRILERALKL